MADHPTHRPWWSHVRFSVRALIVLVLVIGGWLGWVVRGARAQRGAVASIQEAGGSVKYDWEWMSRSPIHSGKPRAPKWLVDRLGVDYFDHVVLINLAGRGSDADLIHIGQLRGLEELYISGPSVTD